MAKRVIRVTRINAADWAVREEGGRDLGHYSNQQEALSVGRKLARTRGSWRGCLGAEPIPQWGSGARRPVQAARGFAQDRFRPSVSSMT
jgi:hypothetical protein